MKNAQVVLLGVLFCASFPFSAVADDIPDFDLRIDAPERVSGEPGMLVEFPATVVLESHSPAGDDEETGAQGWVLSIVAEPDARIAQASTTDTAGDDPPVGYYDDGFKITELTSGPQNEGVISAVALSFFNPISLPRNGESVLLNLKVETRVPEEGEGCRLLNIEFRDGLRGSGMPLHNAITYQGFPRKDDGSARDNDRDREENAEVLICTEASFLRGDCNPDQNLDLSDAVFALQYLFLGGLKPPCIAACDADSDGVMDITDSIYSLLHLFLGGDAPLAPYPSCGVDPTPGLLPCETDGC